MLQSRVRFRFSVDDYEQMIKFGILTENDRVELIHGEILEKMPIGPQHAACVKRLNRLLTQLSGKAAIVSVQDPVRLTDSEPEPDVALLPPRADFYASANPQAADVFLLIEVADTTLEFDREVKGAMYAAAGIAEYWIVNLNDDCLEVYRQPTAAGTYGDVQILRRGQQITVAALPGVAVAADEVL
jgi:Uma2 family endonuclease